MSQRTNHLKLFDNDMIWQTSIFLILPNISIVFLQNEWTLTCPCKILQHIFFFLCAFFCFPLLKCSSISCFCSPVCFSFTLYLFTLHMDSKDDPCSDSSHNLASVILANKKNAALAFYCLRLTFWSWCSIAGFVL